MSSLSPLDPGFTTPEMAEIWTAAARAGAILEFEAALAMAMAEVGLAPLQEAEAVAAACEVPLEDPEGVFASTWEIGTPVIAVVEELRARLTPEQGAWVHRGATSQDAIDTSQMLQAGKALDLLAGSMVRIAGSMLGLMEAHRRLPQMGRTFLQEARPTTFGMRVAGWLEPLLRQIEGLRAVRRGLAIQLGGPVGTRAELGTEAAEVVAAASRHLGLAGPALAWHADRSRMWEIVEAVEAPVRSMAKVAADIALLSQAGVDEVAVRAGGSSSMAGKRNPIDAIHALAAAEACRGAGAMITGARPPELERGLGSWHVEWFALPMVFHTAAATLQAIERLLTSLEVNGEKMASRVPAAEQLDLAGLDPQLEAVVALYDRVVGR